MAANGLITEQRNHLRDDHYYRRADYLGDSQIEQAALVEAVEGCKRCRKYCEAMGHEKELWERR